MQQKLITLIGLGVVTLLVAPGATAQPWGPGEGRRGPGGPGGPARFLELTEEQQAVAREAFEQQRPAMREIREKLRENREARREALETETPDPFAVGELVIEGHALQVQARALRDESKRALEAVLTPEQKQKLEALEAVRGFGGPRGPGGRRGGGERGPRGPGDGWNE
jgi:Spy/CpxP family protein refolding chaperone